MLDGFSMYLAGVVIFRVFFAILFVIKWQWRFAFNPKYKIEENNLEREFKRLKKDKDCQESSDDIEDRAHLELVSKKREKTLKKKARRLREDRGTVKLTRKEVIDETKRLIMEEDMMTNMDDSDDDRLDFIDAMDEEITDKVTS